MRAKTGRPEFIVPRNEARIPAHLDPALMTFREYRQLIDPQHKTHPSSAYDVGVAQLSAGRDWSAHSHLLNTITRKGIVFEVRANVIDRYRGRQYAKRDQDDNLVLRDGEVLYYTPDELRAQGVPRYDFEFAIIEKEGGQVVGCTQDEWGTMLLMVAREYRGFGFGRLLGSLAWSHLPGKPSGGFTTAGINAFAAIHREAVRDALVSGRYRALVREGSLTGGQVRAIIDSAQLDRSRPRSALGLGGETSLAIDPSQWMLYSQSGEFILYDRRLADYWQSDMDDYWLDRCLIGMSYASTGYDTQSKDAYLHHFGGLNEKARQFLILLQLSECQARGETLRLDADVAARLPRHLLRIEPGREAGVVKVALSGKGIDAGPMAAAEARFRKLFDRFGEFEHYMVEAAYAKFDSVELGVTAGAPPVKAPASPAYC